MSEEEVTLTFTLGAKAYRVVEQNSLDDTGLGRSFCCLGIIKLARKWQGFNIPQDSKDQTMYHEITHAILDDIGRPDLSKDENFVNAFSTLLHQFEVTKRKPNANQIETER